MEHRFQEGAPRHQVNILENLSVADADLGERVDEAEDGDALESVIIHGRGIGGGGKDDVVGFSVLRFEGLDGTGEVGDGG